METYIIIIFVILVILTFVVSKNNRRFIIYSITGLKRYFDNKLNTYSYYQKKDIENLYRNLYNYVSKNELNYALQDYVIKDELQDYALKNDLQDYALKDDVQDYTQMYITKDDIQNYIKSYITKDDLKNYAIKDEFVSKKDFLTYMINNNVNRKIDNKESTTNLEENPQKLEIEKYKILSKIVDAIVKDTKYKKDIKLDEKDIKLDENENTIEKTIMNEKLDNILPPSKLYDVYKPNWF